MEAVKCQVELVDSGGIYQRFGPLSLDSDSPFFMQTKVMWKPHSADPGGAELRLGSALLRAAFLNIYDTGRVGTVLTGTR